MRFTVYQAGRWFALDESIAGGSLRFTLRALWPHAELGEWKSLSAAACFVRSILGLAGRVSGPRFWAIADPDRCAGCGVALSAYRPRHTFGEVRQMLLAEIRTGARSRVVRSTVLGKMKEIRETEWREHREQCEVSNGI